MADASPARQSIGLRLQPHEGIAEKSGDKGPMEFSPEHQHGERFAHAGSHKFFGIRVENDLVEWLRIVIEDCRHHAVGSGRDAVAEDCVQFVFPAPEQSCQRSVGGFLPLLAEQMENEK